MGEPVYLSLEDVLSLHGLINGTSSRPRQRISCANRDGLESALARPRCLRAL